MMMTYPGGSQMKPRDGIAVLAGDGPKLLDLI